MDNIHKNNKTQKMIICSVFTVLIIIGAFIKIPIPIVPFTLQLLFTMMAGQILGAKWGALSVLVYIVMGLIGIPVFASGGGIGYVFQPTFGYLIGFCVGSYVTGKISNEVDNPSIKRLLAADFIGLAIVYAFGMVYYYIIGNYIINSPIGLWPLFLYCFILAVPGDIVLCILGAFLGKRLIPIVKRMER